ncbi:MAG: Asp-tRNA(Asn)/Glu-tRNA(Gln) amidotransferase subunit GatC [Candidatus Kapabacteria bacterium]|nr:Asp-tRNA(Asn)/Glu-tRNA(Gln) amidotransferase subunit GatC [Candidatus Kapabacteria bacterium]
METKEIVRNIANLANLEYSESELETLVPQFEKILSYIAVIDNLDLEGIEPLPHIIDELNYFREDEPKQSVSQTDALKNAPKKNDNFFKVPKVLE